MSEFFFERLAKRHDRKGFGCGVDELDRWFRERARQDQDRHVAAVLVLVPVADPIRVAGFYTLSAASVLLAELPASATKKLPRYPVVPAILIGRLARDKKYPGIGGVLLADALQRAANSAEAIAAAAVIVDAKDDRAASFYRRHGFEPLYTSPHRLFITMDSIRVQTDG